jgi:hypothetical protein
MGNYWLDDYRSSLVDKWLEEAIECEKIWIKYKLPPLFSTIKDVEEKEKDA